MTKGATYPTEPERGRPIRLYLNINLIEENRRDGNAIIRVLVNEMIHAYLMITNNEDANNHHGPKFNRWVDKLNRSLPGLRIQKE